MNTPPYQFNDMFQMYIFRYRRKNKTYFENKGLLYSPFKFYSYRAISSLYNLIRFMHVFSCILQLSLISEKYCSDITLLLVFKISSAKRRDFFSISLISWLAILGLHLSITSKISLMLSFKLITYLSLEIFSKFFTMPFVNSAINYLFLPTIGYVGFIYYFYYYHYNII